MQMKILCFFSYFHLVHFCAHLFVLNPNVAKLNFFFIIIMLPHSLTDHCDLKDFVESKSLLKASLLKFASQIYDIISTHVLKILTKVKVYQKCLDYKFCVKYTI